MPDAVRITQVPGDVKVSTDAAGRTHYAFPGTEIDVHLASDGGASPRPRSASAAPSLALLGVVLVAYWWLA